MTKQENKNRESFSFKDPYRNFDLELRIVPIDKLSVVAHQRKPSNYHVKHLIRSIERVGFIVPLIVVPASDGYMIIDGQHRFLAAKELNISKVPVIVVPEKLAELMMNFNIEKELNIREKSYVALALYRQYLENKPDMQESHAELADAIEFAHYVTLGIAYEKSERLYGSSFESILKKCDFFLDEKISEAIKIREKRADKVVEANALMREIVQKLKEMDKWHPFLYQQVLSWANPYKRKRAPTEFDPLLDTIIANLKKAVADPELVLKEVLEE